VPARLRPTAAIASRAILVGDPGRALLLAQELLTEPKMSNHARGLWGYSGVTGEGGRLTIQATGMGGPSAALVLADLAELGVRRAVRVGTCVGLEGSSELGQLLPVGSALAIGGSATSHGATLGEAVSPDPGLGAELQEALGGENAPVTIASFDAYPPAPAGDAVAADLQTAALFACARELWVRLAALLIVAETSTGEPIGKERLEQLERHAGRVAATTLSA
jgi:purine-nucleoside phosphorylase